jgi:DNA replication licensing factor MCM4
MSSPATPHDTTLGDQSDTEIEGNARAGNTQGDLQSSPAAVPSSPLFLPQSSSPAHRGNDSGSQRSGAGANRRSQHPSSDLLRSTESFTRYRYQGRSDLNSTDMHSSPMRRRFFNEPASNRSGNNTSSRLNSDILSSEGNRSDDPTARRIIPSFSSSSIAHSDAFDDALPPSDGIHPEEPENNAPEDSTPLRVIWGTNVSIELVTDRFRNFIFTFKMNDRYAYDGNDNFIDPTGDRPYYVQMLNVLKDTGSTNLNLDVQNLMSLASTRSLATHLTLYPQEVIPIMDQTIKDCLVSIVLDDPEYRETPETLQQVNEIESRIYKVRPYNIGNKKGMRELNPQDIDKLVSIKGLVIRSTPILPDMKNAFFKCNVCENCVVVENDRGIIQEPRKCQRQQCNSSNSMQLIHNRSIFANKQIIKLQETPDIVPDGQTPHSVSLCVYDELVDSCRAGDRIEVCGIFKSSPVKVNPRMRVIKSLFKTYLDVVHIKKVDKNRIGVDTSTIENELREQEQIDEIRKLNEEEVEKIQNVARRSDVYELLAHSLAPSIFEMDDVKKGLLLQLFGGTNKDFKKGSRTRGDINILLCGDPSTSKSQILQYVHKISPRGIYTSGKGSSAVGLTAYVTRDIETKQLVLESGALVLSDGGICCIDEFDKMSDQTRSVLHEVMEQQTISIAKAGIITTLNARTSILASANPIESRYNPNLPVTKNIDLPPPLLSRFDLVFLILDKVDKKLDEQLAKHIANMYLEDYVSNASSSEILPVEFLTGYIQYAKENIHPNLTEEARDELVLSYVAMRKVGEDTRNGGSEKRITATTRQLESLIRLSEAHAKLHLRGEVLVEDVVEAVRLMKSAIKDYATDPLTGRIDMDLIQTGVSVEERRRKEALDKDILKILGEAGETNWVTLMEELEKLYSATSVPGTGPSRNRVENHELGEAITRLEGDGKVIVFGQGHNRRVSINRHVV